MKSYSKQIKYMCSSYVLLAFIYKSMLTFFWEICACQKPQPKPRLKAFQNHEPGPRPSQAVMTAQLGLAY